MNPRPSTRCRVCGGGPLDHSQSHIRQGQHPMDEAGNHRPTDVYANRALDYRCGICRQPVARYTNPHRAAWRHV